MRNNTHKRPRAELIVPIQSKIDTWREIPKEEINESGQEMSTEEQEKYISYINQGDHKKAQQPKNTQ